MPSQNMNFLTPTRGTLQIKGLEDAEFSVTKFNLPSLNLNFTEVPTPFWAGREANTSPVFGPLEIEFIVDEDMKNWLAVFNWMMDLSFRRKSPTRSSDGSIIIYSSNNNPIAKFHLSELIPIFLSKIPFDESVSETTPVIASAQFAMTYFETDKIS